ncbi:MAG: monovalent cation/H(+) antiporter subunit G [Desulfurococcaceae archaeon]
MGIILHTLMELIGLILLIIGAVFELIGAIGILRLPSFYTRMHALTITTIGGAVVPLIGVAFLAISETSAGSGGLYLAMLCIVSAIMILVVAPTGSHSLIRAAYIREKKDSNYTGDS